MATVETDERLEALCRLTATIGFAVRLEPAALEWVSQDLEVLVGRTAAELWPDGWRRLVAAADLPGLDDACRRLLSGEPIARDVRITGAQGRARHCRVAAYPVVDDRDRVTRVYGVLSDVTDARPGEPRDAVAAAIARALFEAPDAESALGRVLEAYASALGASAAGYWELRSDRSLQRVRIWTAPGAETFYLSPAQLSCDDGSLLSRACRGRAPVVIPDVTRDEGFVRRAWAQKSGLHGAVAFPVFRGKEIVGVLEFLTGAHAAVPPALIDALAAAAALLGRHVA